MNKSPEPFDSHPLYDERFTADLAREDRIQRGINPGQDIELSADLALRADLSRLPAPTLPDALRARIIDRAHEPTRMTGWFAMAAAVILSVIVAMAMDPFAQESVPSDISAEDWAQLTLAIETLNRSGGQIASVTTREVGPHLTLPRFEMPTLDLRLEPLPYPNSFRRWFQPGIPNRNES